jgi:P27 family predicted phage terminase small subunit
MPTEATGNRQGGRSKPTALKVLHGDFKHDPQRRNANEPTVRGTVAKPELTPSAGVVWDQLAPMLIKVGVLTPVDVPVMAEFCEATVVVRLARIAVMRQLTGQVEVAPGQASPVTAYARAVNVMTNLGGRMGLSPSDRARLVVPNGEKAVDDLISNG